MVTKKFARARKAMAVALSATLFTGVAQGGGCTVNVDENLLQSLTSLLENGSVQGNFHFNNHGPDQDDVADEPDAGDTDDSPDDPV
ncbi:MAG TPA: hypothetical protein VJZ71_06695 [Phycisphaerae bacterium]|nr:hypothetical protein [Phycisphaerae bacterium]